MSTSTISTPMDSTGGGEKIGLRPVFSIEVRIVRSHIQPYGCI